jgi:hypothetical protein
MATAPPARSFLDRLLSRPGRLGQRDDVGPSQPVVMGLDERMMLRRTMMCEVVAASLEEGGLPAGSYRFRVVAADRRAHSYAVMVDLPAEFMDGGRGEPRALELRAHALCLAARTRFRLHVVGVYWRVQDKPGLTRAPAGPMVQPDLQTGSDPETSASMVFEPAAPDEILAFEQALRGRNPAQVGARIYHSDLASLR